MDVQRRARTDIWAPDPCVSCTSGAFRVNVFHDWVEAIRGSFVGSVNDRMLLGVLPAFADQQTSLCNYRHPFARVLAAVEKRRLGRGAPALSRGRRSQQCYSIVKAEAGKQDRLRHLQTRTLRIAQEFVGNRAKTTEVKFLGHHVEESWLQPCFLLPVCACRHC